MTRLTRFGKTRKRSDRRTPRRVPLPPDLGVDFDDALVALTASLGELATIYKQRQAELRGSQAPPALKAARRHELALQHGRAYGKAWAIFRQRESELQLEAQRRARKAA